MNKLAIIAKRYSYTVAAAVLSLGMLMPIILSGSAGAAQLEQRSAQISTATPTATSVEYTFTFNVVSDDDLEAFIIDFCDTTSGPIAATSCTVPTNLGRGNAATVEIAGSPSAGWTVANEGTSAIRVAHTGAVAVATTNTIEIVVTGFTNPDVTVPNNTVYARIFTYAANTVADAYTSGTPGAYSDNGSVAFAIVPEIDVTAVVRETLTFCVIGESTITPDASSAGDGCTAADGGGLQAPAVQLGQLTGGVYVIDETQPWPGSVYYQLTTNAAHGTTLRLYGDSTLTSGSNSIAALTTEGDLADPGESGFGMQVANAGTVAGPEDGTNLTASSNFPEAADYGMPAAVATPYGIDFAAADGAVRNANGELVFAARAAANTPAGIYNAQYSVIATPSY